MFNKDHLTRSANQALNAYWFNKAQIAIRDHDVEALAKMLMEPYRPARANVRRERKRAAA